MRFFLTLLLGWLIVTPISVYAVDDTAHIDLVVEPRMVGVNKNFTVDIVLYPSSRGVNAIESTVIFDSEKISFENARIQNSLIDLWIVRPTLVRDGVVEFAGIIPRGTASSGLVAQLEFTAMESGDTFVGLENSILGLQTQAGVMSELAGSRVEFTISKQGAGVVRSFKDGNEKIQFLPVEISRTPVAFENEWFVSFLAQNKSSEITDYFVQETSYWQPRSDAWIPVESPYILEDQDRGKYVFIKARDEFGNERVEKISPRWFGQTKVWLAVALILSTFVLILGVVVHKKKRL